MSSLGSVANLRGCAAFSRRRGAVGTGAAVAALFSRLSRFSPDGGGAVGTGAGVRVRAIGLSILCCFVDWTGLN